MTDAGKARSLRNRATPLTPEECMWLETYSSNHPSPFALCEDGPHRVVLWYDFCLEDASWHLVWVTLGTRKRKTFASRAPRYVLDGAGVDARCRVTDPARAAMLTRFDASGVTPKGMQMHCCVPRYVKLICQMDPNLVV
jgi:hypothetical protein